MNHSDQSPTSEPEVLFEAELVSEEPRSAQPALKPRRLRSVASGVKGVFLDNWWAVLLLLFFVTGALGLPVLWASRAFSRWKKVFWSIIVLLYTVALLWGFWIGVKMWWRHMAEELEKI